MPTTAFPARLFVFLASDAPLGLILRRGPAKQICTIGWNRSNDTFELGQWFKGQMYEHRCDLSPDGKHFLYFAAKHKQLPDNGKVVRYGNWTAISRAPYLKALTFWGQLGTYGGGGQFEGNHKFWLNEWTNCDNQTEAVEELRQIPQPFAPWPWGMSDDDIYYFRLQREGWKLHGVPLSHDDIAVSRGRFTLWEKKHNAWTLRLYSCYGENSTGRGLFWQWYQAQSSVNGETLGGQSWEWADFDGDRLVWAQAGKLFATHVWDGGHSDIIELADFNNWKFKAVQAPY